MGYNSQKTEQQTPQIQQVNLPELSETFADLFDLGVF